MPDSGNHSCYVYCVSPTPTQATGREHNSLCILPNKQMYEMHGIYFTALY